MEKKLVTIKSNSHFKFLKHGSGKFIGKSFLLILKCSEKIPVKDSLLNKNNIFWGIKISKKIGNSVTRNKIKRRLRVIVNKNSNCVITTNKIVNFMFVVRKFAKKSTFYELLQEYEKAWNVLRKNTK